MVKLFGGITIIAASFGLYFQFQKKEKLQAICAYIITVITTILTVYSIIGSEPITEKPVVQESVVPIFKNNESTRDIEEENNEEDFLDDKPIVVQVVNLKISNSKWM